MPDDYRSYLKPSRSRRRRTKRQKRLMELARSKIAEPNPTKEAASKLASASVDELISKMSRRMRKDMTPKKKKKSKMTGKKSLASDDMYKEYMRMKAKKK